MERLTRHYRFHGLVAILFGAGILCASAVASAAYISEYFDHGDTQVNLDGLGGGFGWGGDWVRTAGYGSAGDYTKYMPTTNLGSAVPGYENLDNVGGSAGGASRLNRTTWRSTGGLDGTIWMSMLIRFNQGFDSGHSVISFNALHSDETTVPNRFSVRPGNAGNTPQNFIYNNVLTTVPSSTFNFVTNQTYLMMVRIVIDETGTNDRLDIWTHVADATSIATLGTPNFSQADADVFGLSLNTLGLVVRDTRFDAIRISNAANAFRFVTTGIIPEPASAVLLGLAGLLALRRHP
jgi:hypothetical protein